MDSALRRIREAKGLSQPDLAKKADTSQQQIDRLEKGERRLTLSWARRLARALGPDVKPKDLNPVSEAEEAVIVAHVGAGEMVIYLEDQGTLDVIDAPPGIHGGEAVRVRGKSMMPRYEDGDIVFFSKELGQDPANCVGRDCVVELFDGRTYLKRIERGSEKGTFTLRSHNPSGPLLVNQTVKSMAPVTWIQSSRAPVKRRA